MQTLSNELKQREFNKTTLQLAASSIGAKSLSQVISSFSKPTMELLLDPIFLTKVSFEEYLNDPQKFIGKLLYYLVFNPVIKCGNCWRTAYPWFIVTYENRRCIRNSMCESCYWDNWGFM